MMEAFSPNQAAPLWQSVQAQHYQHSVEDEVAKDGGPVTGI
jgi:hypothetical protein